MSSPRNCVDSFLVAGNGTTVVCGSGAQVREPASYAGKACPASAHAYDTAILQFSAVTGKLTGTLYQISIACQMFVDLLLLWANEAGTTVLGYFGHSPEVQLGSPLKTIGQFGLFTGGKFTPLPAPLESYQGYPSITAW